MLHLESPCMILTYFKGLYDEHESSMDELGGFEPTDTTGFIQIESIRIKKCVLFIQYLRNDALTRYTVDGPRPTFAKVRQVSSPRMFMAPAYERPSSKTSCISVQFLALFVTLLYSRKRLKPSDGGGCIWCESGSTPDPFSAILSPRCELIKNLYGSFFLYHIETYRHGFSFVGPISLASRLLYHFGVSDDG